MPPETLEFEEPIAVLLKEIEALEVLPHTDARDRELEPLQRRVESVRAELYRSLTPWQRVLVARHPNRPALEDFIPPVHGLHRDPRRPAIRGRSRDHDRLRRLQGQPVLLVGHVKGSDTKDKIFRNFGYARPEGYRKALRAMRLAEKFRSPDSRLRRYAGRLSRDRVGGAWRRRGDRGQPPRHDDARHADRRHGQRRRRQRRRAGHRGRRQGADAGIRDLQRDSARRLRRDSVARSGEESRSRRGAQDHGAGFVEGRDHRRNRPRADRRCPQRSRGGDAGTRRGAQRARTGRTDELRTARRDTRVPSWAGWGSTMREDEQSRRRQRTPDIRDAEHLDSTTAFDDSRLEAAASAAWKQHVLT